MTAYWQDLLGADVLRVVDLTRYCTHLRSDDSVMCDADVGRCLVAGAVALLAMALDVVKDPQE